MNRLVSLNGHCQRRTPDGSATYRVVLVAAAWQRSGRGDRVVTTTSPPTVRRGQTEGASCAYDTAVARRSAATRATADAANGRGGAGEPGGRPDRPRSASAATAARGPTSY